MLRMPKILLLMLAMMMASAMPMLAKEQYVDPVFGDTIDRTAEDFVTVSLLVAIQGIIYTLSLVTLASACNVQFLAWTIVLHMKAKVFRTV